MNWGKDSKIEIISKGKSIKINGQKDFDLTHIFECGQCFRWNKEDDGSYTGIVDEKAINLRQGETNEDFILENSTSDEFSEFWHKYFDLDRDYSKIKEFLNKDDKIMQSATKFGSGIRILSQDRFETLISFIISQNSNIPRIKKCIEALCENFGKEIGIYKGKMRYGFPKAEVLGELSEDDVAVCRLGYRGRYVIETAKAVSSDGQYQLRNLGAAKQNSESQLRNSGMIPRDVQSKFDSDHGAACIGGFGQAGSYTAYEYLTSLCGVGPKVANCILLFAFQKYDSFPIDVWVKKLMHNYYGIEENNIKEMQRFATEKFGRYGGFAQQYLFYHARSKM